MEALVGPMRGVESSGTWSCPFPPAPPATGSSCLDNAVPLPLVCSPHRSSWPNRNWSCHSSCNPLQPLPMMDPYFSGTYSPEWSGLVLLSLPLLAPATLAPAVPSTDNPGSFFPWGLCLPLPSPGFPSATLHVAASFTSLISQLCARFCCGNWG